MADVPHTGGVVSDAFRKLMEDSKSLEIIRKEYPAVFMPSRSAGKSMSHGIYAIAGVSPSPEKIAGRSIDVVITDELSDHAADCLKHIVWRMRSTIFSPKPLVKTTANDPRGPRSRPRQLRQLFNTTGLKNHLQLIRKAGEEKANGLRQYSIDRAKAKYYAQQDNGTF